MLACRDGDDAVHALAARVEGYDLVLTGTRAEGAYDTGMLPYRVAAALGYPLVGSAVDVTVEGGRVAVRQFCRRGCGGASTRRCRPSSPFIRSPMPSRAMRMRGCAPARSGRRSRRRADADAAAWKVGPIERKPVKLVAAEKRSGHARMLSATTTESRGGNVVNEGSSVEKHK